MQVELPLVRSFDTPGDRLGNEEWLESMQILSWRYVACATQLVLMFQKAKAPLITFKTFFKKHTLDFLLQALVSALGFLQIEANDFTFLIYL